MANKLKKEFISIDKQHSFTISIIEDTAYFVLNYIGKGTTPPPAPKIIEKVGKEEEEKEVFAISYKIFLLLLKDGFQYMTNNGIKYVKQQINYEDKETFKKSFFIEENNILIAKTNIDDFLIELCEALGMNRL